MLGGANPKELTWSAGKHFNLLDWTCVPRATGNIQRSIGHALVENGVVVLGTDQGTESRQDRAIECIDVAGDELRRVTVREGRVGNR